MFCAYRGDTNVPALASSTDLQVPSPQTPSSETSDTNSSQSQTQPTSQLQSPQIKKKTENSDTSIQILKHLKDLDQQIDGAESEDEAALFGKSVAAKLRGFDPYKFALARRNIENVLFDVEYGSQPTATYNQSTSESSIPYNLMGLWTLDIY